MATLIHAMATPYERPAAATRRAVRRTHDGADRFAPPPSLLSLPAAVYGAATSRAVDDAMKRFIFVSRLFRAVA
jgi:hypothetical protein